MGNHKVLRTPDQALWRYSMYDLIEAIKRNNLIWDREHEDFHNRELRQEAWHDVARHVYKSFDDISEREKETITKTLLKRWKNTRDSYLRNWRLKQTENVGRATYIYDKELSFLLKFKEEPSSHSANEADNGQTTPTVLTSNATMKKPPSKRKLTKRQIALKKRFKRERRSSSSHSENDAKKNCDEVEHDPDDDSAWETEATSFEIINVPTQEVDNKRLADCMEDVLNATEPVVQSVANEKISTPKGKVNKLPTSDFSCSTPSISSCNVTNISNMSNNGSTCKSSTTKTVSVAAEYDADQAFFDSIKPHLLKMSSDQKLDFQIDVLKLLKNFRN